MDIYSTYLSYGCPLGYMYICVSVTKCIESTWYSIGYSSGCDEDGRKGWTARTRKRADQTGRHVYLPFARETGNHRPVNVESERRRQAKSDDRKTFYTRIELQFPVLRKKKRKKNTDETEKRKGIEKEEEVEPGGSD